MHVGLVIPSFPCERRVGLLPQDIGDSPDTLCIERGYGATMGIPDSAYMDVGCGVFDRAEIMQWPAIFALKLLQPSDYDLIPPRQLLVGWVHPTGSGRQFMDEVVGPRYLTVVDIDSAAPRVYAGERSWPAPGVAPGFLWENSYLAGWAAVDHALLFSQIETMMAVAILGTGNVAQGAMLALSKRGLKPRMFRRRTMPEFYDRLGEFDIIVNGIEIANGDRAILTSDDLGRLRTHCIVIDAAADAGRAIEGTQYGTMVNPFCRVHGLDVYCVNNTPSFYHRRASRIISRAVWKEVFSAGFERFLEPPEISENCY